METNIKQELRKTYLIAEDKNMTRVDFRFRMLLSNSIKNLLRCAEHNIDDRIRIYYDITGKTSLKDHCIEKGIDESVLKRLVTSLMLMEDECTDYMMEMDNISLDPEHIFMENETVYFCYLPWKEGDILEAFHELITSLLDMGNSTDMESMSLLYELHGVTRHKYSLDDVMTRITRNDPIVPTAPREEPVSKDEDMEQQIRDAKWVTDHRNRKQDEDFRLEVTGDYEEAEILRDDRDMYIPDRRELYSPREAYSGRDIPEEIEIYGKREVSGRRDHSDRREDVSLEKKKRREERREYRRQRMFERFLSDEEYEEDDYDYR